MHYPSGKTHLYAILAHPVAHVRASEFFGPIIEAEKRDAFVVPLHVLPKDLPEMVPMLQRIGNLKGVIITIPHKEAMAQALRRGRAERPARRCGQHGALRGGWPAGRRHVRRRRLRQCSRARNGIEPKGAKVLLLGAGGAARAIAIALADEGVEKITIANRTESRAKELAAVTQAIFEDVEVKSGPADPRRP